MPDARRGRALFAIATIAYAALTAWFAAHKLFWFDELFTAFIARQPDMSRFAGALLHGGDLLPPGIHVLTRAAITLFGEHPVSLRLPSMIGYWLLLTGIYAFVRHRCSATAAWAAALVPLATTTYWYAFEARPYALVAGVSAWALVAWQRTSDARRLQWLAVVALCVATALLFHWHAVLLVAALGVGELVRWRRQNRVQFDVVAAVAIGCLLAAPVLVPFLRHSLEYRGLIDPPDPLTFVYHSYDLMLGGFAPFLAALVALAVYARGRSGDKALAVTGAEWTVATLYALLPILALALAWATGGQALPRYGVPAIFGCAVLIGYFVERSAALNMRAAAASVAILLAAVGSNVIVQKLRLPDRADVERGVQEFALLDAVGRPGLDEIVVPDGLAFVRLLYYAPEKARSFVHVRDPGVLGSNVLGELAAYVPMRIDQLDELMARGGWVPVYDLGLESPLLAQLAARGVRLRPPIGAEPGTSSDLIFDVRLAGPREERGVR